MKKRIKVGLVELPSLKLVDPCGKNWTIVRNGEPLEGKQQLAGTLFSSGCEAELFNLKDGSEDTVFGEVEWRGMKLTKIAFGKNWRHLDPKECDAWVVSVNFVSAREMGCEVIKHLASGGGRVVADGPDPFAEPEPFINAGANAVIMDRSGMSNRAAVEVALGNAPEGYYRLFTRSGPMNNPGRFERLHPEDWPLPPADFVKKVIGLRKELPPESSSLSGRVTWDHGCDRHCDFCEVPVWKLGYQYMSPKRALEWLLLQKKAGAGSSVCFSSQFLGRVLYKNGREEVLEIMKGARDIGMSILWINGNEFAKATLGRGLKNGDETPDEELVRAIWGWNGKIGCAYSYLPAERPLEGPAAFAKLLPYENHKRMIKEIVKAAVPTVTYGVIIGYPRDSSQKIKNLFEVMRDLKDELTGLNPNLEIAIPARSLMPLPGTPLTEKLKSGPYLRFNDPSLVGNRFTSVVDTDYMTYEEISEWQKIFWKTFGLKKGFTGLTAYDD